VPQCPRNRTVQDETERQFPDETERRLVIGRSYEVSEYCMCLYGNEVPQAIARDTSL